MAFTSTPSSGASPYVLNISISNKFLINGVDYKFRLRQNASNGTCPAPGTGANLPISTTLLATNTATVETSIPAGQCGVFTAQILNSLDAVISQSLVTINNV